MKLTVRTGSSSVEYSEPQDDNSAPFVAIQKFDKSERLMKVLKEMCRLCVEMESKQYGGD